MRIVVITVDVAAILNLAFEPVNGEIQTAEATRLVGFLDAADRKLGSRVLAMLR